jgi:glycosyltransferase involved in cell wall biosynthesis
MPQRPLPLHCELGPVLVNRTAVYKMCRAAPRELTQRGFRVRSSALLASLENETAEPATHREQRLFHLSQRWLHWAIAHPRRFAALCPVAGLLPHCRHRGGLRLFLDPLYVLFYGSRDSDVVIVYDITTVSDLGWHHPGVAALYETAFRWLARSGCHIVTSCENTADQLRVNWGIAPSRLTVLPLGLFSFPEPARPASANGSTAPYFLFVGSLEPRKNVDGLLRAFAASGVHGTHGIRLRVIGSIPDPEHPTAVLARQTPGVDLRGFVDDQELAAAYRDCLAFVYPSFCEGFGLPLLEAMHRGAVCLSTICGASPEIAGDAAFYVNPYSPAEIAEGLRRIAALDATVRRGLAGRAQARAQQFHWSTFYDGLARVLRKQAS